MEYKRADSIPPNYRPNFVRQFSDFMLLVVEFYYSHTLANEMQTGAVSLLALNFCRKQK